MTFTSMTFLIFLVLVFVLYWSLKRRSWQNALIALASYVFYGWWDWRFCGLMLFTCVIDYLAAIWIENAATARRRKWWLAASCVSNLGILAVFKYFNFFQENLTALLQSCGWRVDAFTLQIILPVGISFYTFQSMSYTIDVYRRELPASRNLVDFLAYVAFFPQLVAGPIERATNLLPQFLAPRVFRYDDAVDGCRQMLWGFLKKLIIADNLAPLVEAVYGHPEQHGGRAMAAATVLFAFQIYCDFSAYSDIAIGTAKLFGFQLMRNFALPYFALNLTEFWRRWHVSLSTWFRDYLYVPLGGSRLGMPRTIANLMLTFFLSGLWHGASWTFVIWGLLHGVGVSCCTLWRGFIGPRGPGHTDTPGGEGLLPSWRTVAAMAATFAFVCIGWVFFRADNLTVAWTMLSTMVTQPLSGSAAWSVPDGRFGSNSALAIVAGLIVVEWLTRRHPHPLQPLSMPRPIRWLGYTAALWLALYCYPGRLVQFIYFQF